MTAHERDFYTDRSVLLDPYGWYEEMRAKGPVCWMEQRNLVLVTGYAEAVEILSNNQDWSNAIVVSGPLRPLPFTPDEHDITDQLAAHLDQIPHSDLILTKDGDAHAKGRALLSSLFTPSKLKANEAFVSELADTMTRDLAASGGGELVYGVAVPFATYVIGNILGVPKEEQEWLRQIMLEQPPAGSVEDAPPPGREAEWAARPVDMNSPLARTSRITFEYSAKAITERRMQPPRDEVMSQFAHLVRPDGTQPELMELVKAALMLFGAGQDTSAKLIGNATRYLVEVPGLQRRIREDTGLIPAFLEEVLRIEGSLKASKRLALRPMRVGGVDIPAGTQVVIALTAASRDPRRWDDPHAFILDRPRIREHLAFGRGAHTCIGAALTRYEVRVFYEKLFAHTSDIRISEAHHGPAGARRLDYEASHSLRGLANLHIEVDPA